MKSASPRATCSGGWPLSPSLSPWVLCTSTAQYGPGPGHQHTLGACWEGRSSGSGPGPLSHISRGGIPEWAYSLALQGFYSGQGTGPLQTCTAEDWGLWASSLPPCAFTVSFSSSSPRKLCLSRPPRCLGSPQAGSRVSAFPGYVLSCCTPEDCHLVLLLSPD